MKTARILIVGGGPELAELCVTTIEKENDKHVLMVIDHQHSSGGQHSEAFKPTRRKHNAHYRKQRQENRPNIFAPDAHERYNIKNFCWLEGVSRFSAARLPPRQYNAAGRRPGKKPEECGD